MTGACWGSTFTIARHKLEDVKTDYLLAGERIVESSDDKILFSNGDTWRALVPTEHMYYKAVNVSYIDANIKANLVDIINNNFTDNFPFSAHKYYLPEEDWIKEDKKYISGR